MTTIEDRMNGVNRKIEAEKLRHKHEMANLIHERDMVRIDCEHKWRTRSIMGREEVTECKICGKEYP